MNLDARILNMKGDRNMAAKSALRAGLVLALLFLPAAGLKADSLFLGTGNPSLYGKVKAHRVGDIVTIIIVENAKAEQEASTRTEKDSMSSLGLGEGFFSSTANLPVPKFGVGANKFHEGRGLSRRRGMFQATMTAKVTKVLPNGNLVIRGVRYLELNEEIQTIEMEGEIRVADIDENNMILSASVANARIKYKGKGPLNESRRPGLLTRILDWLWIF